MFKSLADPNHINYERDLNKNLEIFPFARFSKLWKAIEIDLKETKTTKIFKPIFLTI